MILVLKRGPKQIRSHLSLQGCGARMHIRFKSNSSLGVLIRAGDGSQFSIMLKQTFQELASSETKIIWARARKRIFSILLLIWQQNQPTCGLVPGGPAFAAKSAAKSAWPKGFKEASKAAASKNSCDIQISGGVSIRIHPPPRAQCGLGILQILAEAQQQKQL